MAVAILAAMAFVIWIVAARRRMTRSTDFDRGSRAVGNAIQELDRLVARPSIESKIQAENPVKRIEDESGGR